MWCLGVEPPLFVELEVVHTEPGLKGDTATNVMKPAEVETGASIAVPAVHQYRGKDQNRYPYRRAILGSSVRDRVK